MRTGEGLHVIEQNLHEVAGTAGDSKRALIIVDASMDDFALSALKKKSMSSSEECCIGYDNTDLKI